MAARASKATSSSHAAYASKRVSTSRTRGGAAEAAASARDALGGRACDLAVCSPRRAPAAPEATLEGVHRTLARPSRGCGAAGVSARCARSRRARRSPSGPRRSTAARCCPFHAEVEPMGDGGGRAQRAARALGRGGRAAARGPVHVPDRRGAARALGRRRRCCRCSAGWASARSPEHETPPLIGDEVKTSGASACGSTARTSPACRGPSAPVGPELTITACDGAITPELAGKPALEKLREHRDAHRGRRPPSSSRAGC